MTADEAPREPGLDAAAAQALELIVNGDRVGLGSGHAVSRFIARLGARVADGLSISAVPASRSSADHARSAGIPLIEMGEDVTLDITIDGADEVAPSLDLVKGWGGALVRERILAAASRRQVILVGHEKLVRALGERGRLPIEVIPLARWPVTRALETMGMAPRLRMDHSGAQPSLTENGNLTIDCAIAKPVAEATAARQLERTLLAIVGVVDTGLFLGTAERVLVGYSGGRVETLIRAGS